VPKYIFFLSAFFWSGVVCYFCLVSSNEIPTVEIPNIDKLVHVFFHFTLTFVWFLFFSKQLRINVIFRPLLYAVLFSFVFGITIEILQELFTTTRHADIFDVLANTTGEVLAVFVVVIFNKFKILDLILKK
jgi:VanZ family protein